MTRAPYSVSDFTTLVRDALAVRPELEDVLVEGEVSNLKPHSSGHLYFTLKDSRAQLSCVCFRSNALRIPFKPENGMTVVAHGAVQVYEAQGRYQLYVDRMDPSGVGALALAIEQLKRALGAAGLFDERHKRPLPLLPRRVVVVTSRTGAAFRDVYTVMTRRAPGIGRGRARRPQRRSAARRARRMDAPSGPGRPCRRAAASPAPRRDGGQARASLARSPCGWNEAGPGSPRGSAAPRIAARDHRQTAASRRRAGRPAGASAGPSPRRRPGLHRAIRRAAGR